MRESRHQMNTAWGFARAIKLWAAQRGYVRPLEVANSFGCSRREAELALQMLCGNNVMGHRGFDGRYFVWATEKENIEAEASEAITK